MEEWERFAQQRLSEQHALRKQQQELQAKNKTSHTMSRSRYSGTKEKLKKKSKTPDAISRVDVWIAWHTRKDDTYINETVEETVKKMQEYSRTTQSSGYSDDALTAVIGPQHGGRVRGLGFGVTMTSLNLWNDGASQKYERTINELKQQYQEMNEKFQRPEERQDQVMQLIQSLSANNQSSPIASHQVSPPEDLVGKSCELLHFHGTKTVVAKGMIDSVDPDSLIGSAPLGSDCWRVWITDLIDSSVPLYRPEICGFDLKDAYVIGFSIAWPIKYIKICQS
ncbi:uncharacterized protein LOC132303017 isoform X3 [Cornus florida]|uniref:uncharacterized protein LOC132303017 isoform X3 n=1 Tax=Cornus florida TaxID=4283 RepID=UPI0028A00F61|nr:uncharacterized protein LOC132303017 isoform X3 [Cornus florida]